jgi:DNA relaxase NicK
MHPRSALPSAHHDAEGGWTTYVGDRGSDFFLRIYDKQAECEHQKDIEGAAYYQNCWRYELEVKGRAARVVADAYYKAPEQPSWISSLVHKWSCAHGIIPTWPPGAEPERLHGFRRRSDRESRLEWLEKSVAPAVRWLLESGDRAEVIRRLGLDEPLGDSQDDVGDPSE